MEKILHNPITVGSPVDARRAEIYREMSPARKREELNRLQNTARKLKAAGVRAMRPDWSEQEIQKAVREIFLYAVT